MISKTCEVGDREGRREPTWRWGEHNGTVWKKTRSILKSLEVSLNTMGGGGMEIPWHELVTSSRHNTVTDIKYEAQTKKRGRGVTGEGGEK